MSASCHHKAAFANLFLFQGTTRCSLIRKLLLQLGLDKIFSALDVAKEIFSRNIGLGGRNQYFFGDARNGNDLIQPHKTVCHDLTHCVADDAAHIEMLTAEPPVITAVMLAEGRYPSAKEVRK